MENIDERLRDTSNRCIKAYEDWKGKEKDPSKREELREAIHELRKVSSRLEIEMAVSEREEMAQKPIPIPPHRAAKGRNNNDENGQNQNGPAGTGDGDSGNSGPVVEKKRSSGRKGGGVKRSDKGGKGKSS